MNCIPVLAALILQSLATNATAQTRVGCEGPRLPVDSREISCPLSATGDSQRFRFKANFIGSHDDTTLSMTATLDGVPLACDEGSKTASRFEDGEVSLECRFGLQASTGPAKILGVKLVWSHAQHTDFELVTD